jgi:transposase-like protein
MSETQDRSEALRLKLARSRDSRRRVPGELRAEAFAKAEHASGQRYKSIARTLGLKADTLMRWCRDSREPKFARVVVKRAAQPHLTVHGPRGTRIEQLSIQQVAELFGALSCSD